MWSTILRLIPPVLVLGGGLTFFVYGITVHTVPVSEEQEIEDPFGPSMFGASPFEEPPPGAPDGFPPMVGPPPFPSELKEKVIVTEDESEPTLIREVSYGGVTLLASGELRRTYSGEPPSLCPT